MQTIAKHQIKLMFCAFGCSRCALFLYTYLYMDTCSREFSIKFIKQINFHALITINENVWCNLMVAVKRYIMFHNDISRKIATCCHNDVSYANVNAKHKSKHDDAYILMPTAYSLRITFINYRVVHLSWHLMCMSVFGWTDQSSAKLPRNSIKHIWITT